MGTLPSLGHHGQIRLRRPWRVAVGQAGERLCCRENRKAVSKKKAAFDEGKGGSVWGYGSVPSPRGGFRGLTPTRQSSKTPQTETWNTIKQWCFCPFLECQAPLHKRNAPPIVDFLSMVLLRVIAVSRNHQEPRHACARWRRSNSKSAFVGNGSLADSNKG